MYLWLARPIVYSLIPARYSGSNAAENAQHQPRQYCVHSRLFLTVQQMLVLLLVFYFFQPLMHQCMLVLVEGTKHLHL